MISIAARFNGPPDSGNGGYCSGVFSSFVDSSGADAGIEVTLRRPPPLDTPLEVEFDEQTLQVYAPQRVLIAQARSATVPAADAPAAVAWPDAVAASPHFRGFAAHPFPTCFVCGPGRSDGMRLFAGPLPGNRTATPWRVPDEAGPAWVWAALDCPGGWTTPLEARPYVLGRIAARVAALPAAGDTCVIVGELRGEDGRKAYVHSALYGPDGDLLAHARATWIGI
jgi:hypothetical protein